MRGRCERHQLALGPQGCLLCRREAAAPATAAARETAVAAEVAGDLLRDLPASSEPPARAPRLGLWQSVLLVPLVAATFYFLATTEARSPSTPGSQTSSAAASEGEPAAADPRTPGDDEARPTRPSFDVLVIEEPAAPERSALPTPERNEPSTRAARKQPSTSQASPGRHDSQARELAAMRERVDVIVYSTSWCPACRSLRSYLAERGIRSTEYDIERNRAAQLRQRQLNPRGSVPTVDIDGQVLVGFSSQSIEAALDRAARARLQRL